MTLNSSGPIGLGGSTAGQSVNLELGNSATAQISFNDAAVRSLTGTSAGSQLTMASGFWGKSNRTAINLSISTGTYNYNVYSAAGGAGYVAGKSDITVTVNSGVYVGSTSTGAYAMTVSSSFASGDTVTIVNNGTIEGMGGAGGVGGNASWSGKAYAASNGGAGNTGGNALSIGFPTRITNNSIIAGGGGGGGGGGGAAGAYSTKSTSSYASCGGGGGGGGAGYNGGAGGSGGTYNTSPYGGNGGAGNSGTQTAGGSGGTGANSGASTTVSTAGNGGTGGNQGANGNNGGNGSGASASGTGGSGGSAGYYLVGSAYVTWNATGTRYGNVS